MLIFLRKTLHFPKFMFIFVVKNEYKRNMRRLQSLKTQLELLRWKTTRRAE